MTRFVLASVGAAAALSLAACGDSGDTTTVIREVPPPEAVEQESAAESPPERPAAGVESPDPREEPPNVVGLPLPDAEGLLRQAGYRTAAKNTDTTFGIVVPDNYTICRQGKPRGDLVVVLAQKYGC